MEQNSEPTISTWSEIGQLGNLNSALAPVSSLPNEILENIFFEYAVEMDIFSQDWIDIMLVCRHWTNVALNHGKLWAFIYYDSSEDRCRTELRLQRSKDFPLSCFFNCDEEQDIMVMSEVLFKHGPRIWSLEVHLETDDFEKVVQNALGNIEKFFPKLDTLSVYIPYLRDVQVSGAPKLRNITLKGVPFTGWNHLSDLTELTLHVGYVDFPPVTVTVHEFLSMLRRSPRIRVLDLFYYLPIPQAADHEDLSPDADNKVHLPHLDCLRLFGEMEKIQFLLQSLTYPSTSSVYIQTEDRQRGDDLLGLLKTTRLRLRGSGAPVLRSVAIIIDQRGVMVVADTAESYTSTESNTVHFSLTFPTTTRHDSHRLLLKILNAIPLESTRHLFILLPRHDTIPMSLRVWRAIFQRLPHLEVITASDRDILQVLKGLSDSVQRGMRGLSGRRRRRAAYSGLAPPTCLQVAVPWLYVVVPSAVASHFEALAALLAAFKAMEAPFKPAGVPLGTLDIEGIERDLVPACGVEPLRSIVGQLLIKGQPWIPVTQAEGGAN